MPPPLSALFSLTVCLYLLIYMSSKCQIKLACCWEVSLVSLEFSDLQAFSDRLVLLSFCSSLASVHEDVVQGCQESSGKRFDTAIWFSTTHPAPKTTPHSTPSPSFSISQSCALLSQAFLAVDSEMHEVVLSYWKWTEIKM